MQNLLKLLTILSFSLIICGNAIAVNQDEQVLNEIKLKRNLVSKAMLVLGNNPDRYNKVIAEIDLEVEKHAGFLGKKFKKHGYGNTALAVTGISVTTLGSGLFVKSFMSKNTFVLPKGGGRKSVTFAGLLLMASGIYTVLEADSSGEKASRELAINADYDLALNKIVDGLFLIHKGDLLEKMKIKNSLNRKIQSFISDDIGEPKLDKLIVKALKEHYSDIAIKQFLDLEKDLLNLTALVELNLDDSKNSNEQKLELIDACLAKIYITLKSLKEVSSDDVNNLIESIEETQ